MLPRWSKMLLSQEGNPKVDVNGDGDISQEEFIEGYLKMHDTVGKGSSKNSSLPRRKSARSVMKYVKATC